MMPLPTKLQKPPAFSVINTLLGMGYVAIDGDKDYAYCIYPKGTTRIQIKQRSIEPILRLRQSEIAQIEEWARSEDDILIGATSIATSGALPDPIAQRVEAAVARETAALSERLRVYEERESRELAAKLAKEKADDEKLLAEEKAAAATKAKTK